MNLEEYILCYDKLGIKRMTKIFNEFSVDTRLEFLETLSDSSRKKFINNIRNQAVEDFWFHEREAIMNGECTRDWTPEQIEQIMNISEKSGAMSTNAGKGLQVDGNGMVVIDNMGNKSYYGHHMIDVSTHPEYAGDWKNIQALTYEEHYNGAHENHNTKEPTKGYYDYELGETQIIDVDVDGFSFEKTGYPPKRKCIFKSEAEMKTKYSNYDSLTDGEKLALKNVDLAMSNGDMERFNNALELAKKYNSQNFCEKIGLKTADELKQMYGILQDCDDADIIRKYQFYEYSARNGYDVDTQKYVVWDEDKLKKLFGEENYNNFGISQKEQAVDLADELDEFLNTTDSSGGSTSNNNTSNNNDAKEGSVGNKNTTGNSGTSHTETNTSESSKTNTSDSSNKSTGTNETSSSDNSDTKKTNVSDTGSSDDGKGTQKEIKDTESSNHTGDVDIKDGNSSKYIPGESTSDKSASSKKGRDVDLESESAKKYLGATGKTADELDDIDKAMINIADKYANNPKGVSDFAKSLGKNDDILKAGSNTLGYVDAVCTAIYAVQVVIIVNLSAN